MPKTKTPSINSWKKIKTYEDACKVINEKPRNLPDVSMLSKKEAAHVINSIKMHRVIRALNTDQSTGKVWEPNWNDSSQYKYSWWVTVKASDKKPQGFAFSFSFYYDLWFTATVVGSRLLLESSDKVYHLHRHFKKLLIEYLLITK